MIVDIELGEPRARGALTLYPLVARGPAAPAYLSGPAAVAQGAVSVSELDGGASVPQLEVLVTARIPVLLLEGETLVGAKQNRTMNVSVLCPPGRTVVPVSCVEAGRWDTAAPVTRSPRHAPPSLRHAKTASVGASVRQGEGRQSDQQAVWNAVGGYAARFAAPAPTAALEDVYRHVDRDVQTMVADLRPAPGQHGVVVAVGGRAVALDVFDTPATLEAYWDGLLAGYALDAIGAAAATPAVDDVRRFVRAATSAEGRETEAVGLGRELHLAGDGITGFALRWTGAVVHLAAFATGNNTDATPIHPTPPIRRQWFTR